MAYTTHPAYFTLYVLKYELQQVSRSSHENSLPPRIEFRINLHVRLACKHLSFSPKKSLCVRKVHLPFQILESLYIHSFLSDLAFLSVITCKSTKMKHNVGVSIFFGSFSSFFVLCKSAVSELALWSVSTLRGVSYLRTAQLVD